MIGRVPRRQVRLVVLHIAIVCRHHLARTGNNPERDVVGRSVIDVAVSIDDHRGEQPSVLAIRPAATSKLSQQALRMCVRSGLEPSRAQHAVSNT